MFAQNFAGHEHVVIANSAPQTYRTLNRRAAEQADHDRTHERDVPRLGAPAIDLAVATDAVWVANGSDGTVARIDPNAETHAQALAHPERVGAHPALCFGLGEPDACHHLGDPVAW